MARAGVTYVDIKKAAEMIKSLGHEPTVDRVREQLKTGSKSTIAPLLKRWRSDNNEAGEVSGLPNDLVEAVKSLHERTKLMAENEIEKARTEFLAISEALHKELADARHSVARLTSDQESLEQKIQIQTEEANSLRKSLEDMRILSAKTESQLEMANSRVNEAKVMIEELKKENRDVRDHFEHYQQRTAEDRHQEREQFRVTNQQSQSQIQKLTDRVTQAEAHILGQTKFCDQQRSTIDELNLDNHTLQNQLDNKKLEIETLGHQLEAVAAEEQESKQRIELLREKVMALESYQSVAHKEIELLNQALKKSETDLRDAKDKIEMLTDENKMVLQEKAVIQGQFKQLQSSIQRRVD